VNRTLQQLRDDVLITLAGKRLTVLDLDRLRSFAEFDPNYLHLEKRGGQRVSFTSLEPAAGR